MRHTRSVTRAIVGLLATFVSFALFACGVAAANTVMTGFEPPTFAPGSVNGQDGWKSIGPFDQAVVTNVDAPDEFGLQSLRMSNSYVSAAFFNQTYSKPAAPPVGEKQANTEYTAQFSFISTTPASQQPGLIMSVSPDSNEGSRMSYVGLTDAEDGIQVTVFDTPEVNGSFVAYDAAVLDRTMPHTIKFWIKVKTGPDNDVVRVYIDGRDVGQCFTTWENYYRTHPEQTPPPNVNTPANINSLQFRSSVGPGLATGGGYLFDDVTVTTANGPGPQGCDLVIDKKADARTVTAGGLAGYTITVRNRGRGSARNVRVCDRVPRRMTFVGANRKLSRLGGRRCLVIPRLGPGQRVSLHVDFRVDASAPSGTVENIADVTPGAEPPGSPEPPGAGDVPRSPAVLGARVAVKRAKAVVRVLARRVLPSVTG